MSNRTEVIKFRVTPEEKKLIQEKGRQEGFTSTSAFIKASSKNYISLSIDTSDYLKLLGETRKIGRNINSLIRDIRYSNIISDMQINSISKSLNQIELILKREEKELSKLENRLNLMSSKKIISLSEKYQLEPPIEIIYKELIEMIKDNLLIIVDLMKRDKWSSHTIEFVYKFIYSLLPDKYSPDVVSKINNEVYKYTQSITNKLVNDLYKYNEQDYTNLMNIIDKYF